jgi:poly [ADP-ribose] polymerase
MVSTRNQTGTNTKRAASPDVEPVPKKKQARGRPAKAAAQLISDDDDPAPPPPKKASAATLKKENAAKLKKESDEKAKKENDEKVKKASAENTFKEDSKYGKTNGKALSDGQYAKAANLVIPVDEECPLSSYQVYVDSSEGIIYDA